MNAFNEYLANITPSQKAEFERLFKIVKRIVPEAVETISYGMPAFKYKNKPLIYFGAFKDHMSLFPTAAPVEELKEKLAAYKLSRGTIQFTEDNPISENLLSEIIQHRINTINQD